MSVDVVIGKKYLVTCKEIKEYKCTWTIKDMRNREIPVGHREDSPRFFAGEYEWEIELYFGGVNSDSKDYVGFRPFLISTASMPSDCEVTIIMSIIDKNNKERMKQTLTRKNQNSVETFLRKFVKIDDLLSSSTLLTNDELKLMCCFSYDVSTSENRYFEVTDTPWPTLRDRNPQVSNFDKIFENPEYSDFQLNVGNTKFQVHRCILAAHSPVFATMFRTDMIEKAKNEADIEDVEVNVMKQLLRFIYVGTVENIDEMVDKLFIAADKYQVLQLRELCEEKLLEQLSIDSIGETLHFVDKFDTTILKNAAIYFTVSNSSTLSVMDEFEESIQSLSSRLLAQVVRALMRKTE